MNPITDDDLVLYHYRDGLDADRIGQITAALATSETLRERYAAIERAVAQFGHDEIAPDPNFNERLWRGIEPQLEQESVISTPASARGVSNALVDVASATAPAHDSNVLVDVASVTASAHGGSNALVDVASATASAHADASASKHASTRGRASIPTLSISERLRAWLTPPQLWPGLAAAAVLGITVSVAFIAGRQSVTVSSPVASTEADAAAARVLDAYVAANLRATERVLLTASNSNDASLLEGNRELAQSLVESNRLYALAAARAGNTRLATFLRQLEPILISLANQPGSAAVQSSEDLRHFLDTTDLLFQVRATEARLDRAPDNDGDSRI
jgi:hypothetical protein